MDGWSFPLLGSDGLMVQQSPQHPKDTLAKGAPGVGPGAGDMLQQQPMQPVALAGAGVGPPGGLLQQPPMQPVALAGAGAAPAGGVLHELARELAAETKACFSEHAEVRGKACVCPLESWCMVNATPVCAVVASCTGLPPGSST